MTGNIYQSIPAPGLRADVILVVHALIVCFVIVGQLLILAGWWRGWAWAGTSIWTCLRPPVHRIQSKHIPAETFFDY